MAPTRVSPKATAQTQTRPRTYSITLKSLFSLPFRLCNPPPAVGKVRSCGVTPLIKVRLEDVLNRQHLPPLGLKDFEEWLLFVEMSPENLYFILWLREYKQRYAQWLSQTSFHLRTAPSSHEYDTPHYSTHLAMFYARAKQTFFTPGSAYELNLTNALLGPFHTKSPSMSTFPAPSSSANIDANANTNAPSPIPHTPPYPPPESFHDIELETYRTLDASLSRFVQAQLNNVGNRRVLCGILAGLTFVLLLSLTPLAVLLSRHSPRLIRLAAFPGLWLGLTVLFASLNGICLGVYIFGDLRQLRKFELARVEISRPKALPAFKPIAEVVRMGVEREREERERIQAKEGVVSHTQRTHRHHHHHHKSKPAQTVDAEERKADLDTASIASSSSSCSSGSSANCSSSSCSSSSSSDDGIHISPAYYDADDVEQEQPGGWRNELMWDAIRPHATAAAHSSPVPPLTLNMAGTPEHNHRQLPMPPHSPASSMASGSTVFTGTATFIHPFDIALDVSALGADALPNHTSNALSMNTNGAAGTRAAGFGIRATEEEDEEALARAMMVPARHQRVAPFDFDGLPDWEPERCRRVQAQSQAQRSHPTSSYVYPQHQHSSLPFDGDIESQYPGGARGMGIPRPPEPARAAKLGGVRGVLARMQEKSCGLASWRLQVGYLEEEDTHSAPAWDERSGVSHSRGRSASTSASTNKSTSKTPGGQKKVKPHWSSPYWAQVGGGRRPKTKASPMRAVRASSDSEKTRMGDVEEGYGFGFEDDKDQDENKKATSKNSPTSAAPSPASSLPKRSTRAPPRSSYHYSDAGNETCEDDERNWRERLKAVWSVPAFAVPLARVLSPVVVRGQWEIVVRSAVAAGVLAGVGVGVMVALPVV